MQSSFETQKRPYKRLLNPKSPVKFLEYTGLMHFCLTLSKRSARAMQRFSEVGNVGLPTKMYLFSPAINKYMRMAHFWRGFGAIENCFSPEIITFILITRYHETMDPCAGNAVRGRRINQPSHAAYESGRAPNGGIIESARTIRRECDAQRRAKCVRGARPRRNPSDCVLHAAKFRRSHPAQTRESSGVQSRFGRAQNHSQRPGRICRPADTNSWNSQPCTGLFCSA